MAPDLGLHRISSAELRRLLRALHRRVLPEPITRSALIAAAFGDIEGHLDLLIGRDLAAARALVIAVLGERGADARAAVTFSYCGVSAPGTRSRDTLERVRELLASATESAHVYGLRCGEQPELLRTLQALRAGRELSLRLVFDARELSAPVASVRAFVAAHLRPGPGLELFAAPALCARAVVVDGERVLVTGGELSAREDDGCIDFGASFNDRNYARALAAEWSNLLAAGACVPVPWTRGDGSES